MQDQRIRKKFAKDKEDLIKTLSRFDQQVTVEDVVGIEATLPSHFHAFFMQVLLEQVCSVVEPEKEKRSILFKKVVDYLSESKFLNKSLVLDDLMPLRREAAENFFHFVKKVQSEVIPNASKSNANLDTLLKDEEFPSQLQLKNKYNQDFEEVEVIAKGGFGTVCKVKHKLDDGIYAIKKIVFKYKSDSRFLKVIQEAKNIAALYHVNIVSYNNAWIECIQPSEMVSDSGSTSKSSDECSSDELESKASHKSCRSVNSVKSYTKARLLKELHGKFAQNNCSVVTKNSQEFVNFTSNTFERFDGHFKYCKKNHHKYEGDSSDEDSEFSEKENDIEMLCSNSNQCNYHYLKNALFKSSESSWNLNHLNVKVMLCIQMEYCDCDLYQWLQCRAEGEELPFEKDVMSIFKEILQGVVYIHSKHIIHRDLKPQNIFFSKKHDVMKIGDFGLATLADFSYKSENGHAVVSYSSNLGTVPYAAPEQRNPKSIYDSKVDIYSLGIILIELLNKFPTQMEFSLAIDDILKGKFPEIMIMKWSNLIELVKNLVQIDPQKRMTASDILNHQLFEDNSERREKQWTKEVIDLKKKLFEKEQEITELKKLLFEKNQQIENLNKLYQ